MKQFKKWFVVLCALVFLCAAFSGCQKGASAGTGEAASFSETATAAISSSDYDLEFTARDLDVGYDESTATKITLSQEGSAVSGSGADVNGNVITISAEGTYLLSGSLADGQVVVAAEDTAKIQLVLNQASITCSNSAALYVKQADKVFVTLAQGTENALSDTGDAYTQADEGTTVDGVIFSKEDITINGSGSLKVSAGYRHGIVSKDDLAVTGGNFEIEANGQGLSGKDCVKIGGGTFTLNTQKDAVQSDNAEESGRGFIYIKDGTFSVHAETDAFQAETLLQIDAGNFEIVTGGGSANASTKSGGEANPGWGRWGSQQSGTEEGTETASAKGLKAGSSLIVNGGSFQLDTSDDSLHSNGDLTITNGVLNAQSGDDGVHADNSLVISGGNLTISKSYEGLEGKTILISGGTIDITASDDGVNSSGGSDTGMQGRPGQNTFSSGNADNYLRITGGTLTVDAGGDGLDSNGDFFMDGGTVYVNGPTSSADGALDYDGTAEITGGTIIAAGSSGMAQGFSDTSSQYSILYNFSSSLSNTPVSLKDSSGNTVVSWTPSKQYNSVVISSPDLKKGETYTLTAGSMSAGLTLTSVVTSNGGGGMGGGPGGGGPGGRNAV